jgi:hypothetical protein
VPALHGVRLLLDAASTEALSLWLDGADSADSPTVEVRLAAPGDHFTVPSVLDVLISEPTAWLGRTETGLIVGDDCDSWLTIEGSPPVVCGVLRVPGNDRQPHPLLLGALVIALGKTGVHILHAATVCTAERALVLVGDSGAGKSTTVTALASVGCRYLGDDGIFVRKRSGGVELLAYGPSFRLTDHVLPIFERLRPHLSRSTTDIKWSLDASSAFPNAYLGSWLGPTSLLFLGRSARRQSELSSLSLAEATGLLIAQSQALGLDCHPNPRQHLDLLALLASKAHIARLDLGREWLEDPSGAARRLLEQAHVFSPGVRSRNEVP